VDAPSLWSRRLPAAGTVALALAAGWLLPAAQAADKKDSTVETVAYQGWKNNLRLSNADAELVITLDVGPRVMSYKLNGGKNVFKEFPEQMGKSGEKTWVGRGGHRLWTAPEDLTRTYAPDNGPVKYQELPAKEAGVVGVRVTQPPDAEYGVQKEMDISLSPGGRVELVHRITNVGNQPTGLSVWCLSMMAPGGVEVIPLPPKKPHPGDPKNARSPADFAPDQHLALWPYFDFKDPRWKLGSKYITLHQDAKRGPTKIGLAHRLGWVGYLNGGTLFVKRFDYQPDQPYPDGGCNYETFTNQDMLEMESLGPLVRLAPGARAEHVEHWELHKDVPEFKDEQGIDKNVLPLLKEK
jgi:hypothetical protein